MAKKQFFCLVDTETTIKGTVADFAAVIVDRKGKVYHSMACLVHGHYGKYKLFYDKHSADEIWTLKGLEKREARYKEMLNNGDRILASVDAINKWIRKAQETYPNLVFTAYNAAFDLGKMANTGICQNKPDDLDALVKTGIDIHGFAGYFCMWRASADALKGNRKYIRHCINRKWVTAKLNIRTNAEAVAEYVLGRELPPEPHTALEDCLDYELPILIWLLKRKSWKKYSQQGYNWQDWQLKNLVKPV